MPFKRSRCSRQFMTKFTQSHREKLHGAPRPQACSTCAKCFRPTGSCSCTRRLSTVGRRCRVQGIRPCAAETPADAHEAQGQEGGAGPGALQPRLSPDGRAQRAPEHAQGPEALPVPPLWQDHPSAPKTAWISTGTPIPVKSVRLPDDADGGRTLATAELEAGLADVVKSLVQDVLDSQLPAQGLCAEESCASPGILQPLLTLTTATSESRHM
ncbi:hypothetical protein CB1_001683009 [Camelus ferus]|nr:hypothetical protein CB1_001683009 [Camelus ferus]